VSYFVFRCLIRYDIGLPGSIQKLTNSCLCLSCLLHLITSWPGSRQSRQFVWLISVD